MFSFEPIEVGPLQVNCYVVASPDIPRAYIVDPGADAPEILRRVHAQKCPPETVWAIVLTHAHFDHIGATAALSRELNVPIFLHENDTALYSSSSNAMPPYFPPCTDLLPTRALKDTPDFRVLHTPGHTPGGCALYFSKEGVCLTGDTLFAGSVGRTDFPSGNTADLFRSIEQQLLALPDTVRILPGHGPESTIGTERAHNPYFKHFR